MPKYALAIHAHFYQPPRAHPLTKHIGAERAAAPYRNWNEWAADLIYRPNATLGNFGRLSFDVGQSLLDWLGEHDPQTYRDMISAVGQHQQNYGVLNVLGVPFRQVPLPLLRPVDRLTLLRWGKAEAIRRFWLAPLGVCLPQLAADLESLQAVQEAGYRFTILKSSQVEGLPPRGGAGPYRLALPNGADLSVFIMDEGLSGGMLEEMRERGGAGYWARQRLADHCHRAGPLSLIYLSGESLGQNRMGEASFLYYLLQHEAQRMNYQAVTLAQYYQAQAQPLATIQLATKVQKVYAHEGLLWACLGALDAIREGLLEQTGREDWMLQTEVQHKLAHITNPLVSSYLAMVEAITACSLLEQHPTVNLDHVLTFASYSLYLLERYGQQDLRRAFWPALTEGQQARFQELWAQFENLPEAPGRRLQPAAKQEAHH
jgi:hypothetical protein